MNNTARVGILKHAVFVVIMLLLYVLQTVPGLFVIYGAKPIWVIPAAIALAMLEGEFAGGIYGALAGLLCDAGGFLLFGFNGLIASFCCIVSGLLVVYLMRCNLITCLLFSLVTLFIRGSIEYFFAYGMWNHENSIRIYIGSTIPTAVYSALVAVPLFYLLRRIHRAFATYEDGML